MAVPALFFDFFFKAFITKNIIFTFNCCRTVAELAAELKFAVARWKFGRIKTSSCTILTFPEQRERVFNSSCIFGSHPKLPKLQFIPSPWFSWLLPMHILPMYIHIFAGLGSWYINLLHFRFLYPNIITPCFDPYTPMPKSRKWWGNYFHLNILFRTDKY